MYRAWHAEKKLRRVMADEANQEVSTPAPRPHGGRPDGPRPDRGPGGGGRDGGRKFFRRKKVCKFCVEKIDDINYKDVRLLQQFVA
jgi:small subunit ribosomal protein S18